MGFVFAVVADLGQSSVPECSEAPEELISGIEGHTGMAGGDERREGEWSERALPQGETPVNMQTFGLLGSDFSNT